MSRPIELTETLEKVNVPSAVADRSGTITWLNDAAKRSFGDPAKFGQRLLRAAARFHFPAASGARLHMRFERLCVRRRQLAVQVVE